MSAETQIVYSSSGDFYAVIGVRECGIWLSIAKHPLPVPPEWHRPGVAMACLIRGRDYYRVCTVTPQNGTQPKFISADDELVKDYREAAWWTPSLEEAWTEIQGLNEALCEATKLRVDAFHTPRSGPAAPQNAPQKGASTRG
jgi:hypothetical protein